MHKYLKNFTDYSGKFSYIVAMEAIFIIYIYGGMNYRYIAHTRV